MREPIKGARAPPTTPEGEPFERIGHYVGAQFSEMHGPIDGWPARRHADWSIRFERGLKHCRD